MSDLVLPFRAVDPVRAESVVDVCRELLERAEAGRITSLVFVAGCTGGDLMRGHVITEGTPLMGMIGAASLLHRKLMDEVCESMESDG